jgi:heme/copper-type cytochrome/quinol oxidase subunit 4
VKPPRLSRHQKTIRLFTGLVLVVIVLATIYIFWNLNVKPNAP